MSSVEYIQNLITQAEQMVKPRALQCDQLASTNNAIKKAHGYSRTSG